MRPRRTAQAVFDPEDPDAFTQLVEAYKQIFPGMFESLQRIFD